MLAKAFHNAKQTLRGSSLVAFTSRGVYKPGTEPHVFINKHTKVICQGMTGKHVRLILKTDRARSIPSRRLTTGPRWWEA